MARNTIMARKPTSPISLERDGPWEQEGDFQVEQDEQDGDQVVAHVELHARVFEGLEAALVRCEFFSASGRVGTKNLTDTRLSAAADQSGSSANDGTDQTGNMSSEDLQTTAQSVAALVAATRA